MQAEDETNVGQDTGRFKRNLLRIHNERVKYMMTLYLRVRLQKVCFILKKVLLQQILPSPPINLFQIEMFIQSISDSEELKDKLSDDERKFANGYELKINIDKCVTNASNLSLSCIDMEN